MSNKRVLSWFKTQVTSLAEGAIEPEDIVVLHNYPNTYRTTNTNAALCKNKGLALIVHSVRTTIIIGK